MASFPGPGSTVSYSIALHLLISRCPDILPSPAASLGWSLARYTNWLEDHQRERERLLLGQGVVEAYVAAARARQDKSFVPLERGSAEVWLQTRTGVYSVGGGGTSVILHCVTSGVVIQIYLYCIIQEKIRGRKNYQNGGFKGYFGQPE